MAKMELLQCPAAALLRPVEVEIPACCICWKWSRHVRQWRRRFPTTAGLEPFRLAAVAAMLCPMEVQILACRVRQRWGRHVRRH
ncbi:Os10g0349350 [Oryza sativa Japonica Group]|uniref:Os10g0349350 protein n=1 Tax=Oryza sativa subsp. japonica TaxID=39947 RepID=A0A0P0XTR7_ORYSJ|nr:Os10g0349350 [Oryza sativa Japonica Group]